MAHTSSTVLSKACRFRNVTIENVIILKGKLFVNEIFYFFFKGQVEKREKYTGRYITMCM